VVFVSAIVLSGGLAWLALAVIGAFRPGMFWRAYAEWTYLANYAGVLLVGTTVLGSLGRRASIRQLRCTFWLLFLVVGALVGLLAPGAIIFFLIPALIALAGIIGCELGFPTERIGALVAILFLYFTWGAMIGLLQELLNGGPMWVFAPLAALLLLPALIECKPLIDKARLPAAAAFAGILVLAAWAMAAAAPAYSADRQQRFVIQRVADASKGKSLWSIVNDGKPLPAAFGKNWRWDKLPFGGAARWIEPAPADPGSRAPGVKLLSEIRNGDERTLTLRLSSNGNDDIELVAPDNAKIRSTGVPGFVRPIDPDETGKYYLGCSGRSCDGATLQLTTDEPRPIRFLLIGSRYALPQSAGPLLAARPPFARPQYNPDASITFAPVNL
jgi:hypothetical protein